MESCQQCLKKNQGACSWFVDPLNNQAYCMDNSDCDDLDSGTPASCTKGTFAFGTFPDASKSKAARDVCKVFPKKLKKQKNVPPPTPAPVPTQRPTFPPFRCRKLYDEDGQRLLPDCD